jgi:hypothetical protein
MSEAAEENHGKPLVDCSRCFGRNSNLSLLEYKSQTLVPELIWRGGMTVGAVEAEGMNISVLGQ